LAFPRNPKRLLGELSAAQAVKDARTESDLREELEPSLWELLLRPFLFVGSLALMLALYAAFPEGTPLRDLRRILSLGIAWMYVLSVLFAMDWLIYKVRRQRELLAWHERRIARLEQKPAADAGEQASG
jgi:hypothetical protein